MPKRSERAKERPSLDEGAVELASLLSAVLNAIKRRAPAPPRLGDDEGDVNLGPRHAPLLFAVDVGEGLSVGEIAERIGLSVATTSLMVGELSRAGIVDRREDERDRRRTIVTIPAGLKDSISGWRREMLAPMSRTLERLPDEERDAFLRGMEVLLEENRS